MEVIVLYSCGFPSRALVRLYLTHEMYAYSVQSVLFSKFFVDKIVLSSSM